MKHWLMAVWTGLAIFLSGSITYAQDTPPHPEQEAQQLVINADGSINYIEPFGQANESLLQYKSKPRPTIDLLTYLPNEQRKVSIVDYNVDGKPDFIHLEHLDAEGNSDMVGLYRGTGHKIHEESHLDHALKHRFIHSDSTAERQLRERLDAIRARTIRNDEIGVFSGYGLFAELNLPSIRGAFESADRLFEAISSLTKKSMNNMEHIPDIAATHAQEVRILLSTNPHDLSPEIPLRDRTPQPSGHPEDE
jgi:hypothetical protein